eukprot:jgi/Mesen1/4032/ME000212S03052
MQQTGVSSPFHGQQPITAFALALAGSFHCKILNFPPHFIRKLAVSSAIHVEEDAVLAGVSMAAPAGRACLPACLPAWKPRSPPLASLLSSCHNCLLSPVESGGCACTAVECPSSSSISSSRRRRRSRKGHGLYGLQLWLRSVCKPVWLSHLAQAYGPRVHARSLGEGRGRRAVQVPPEPPSLGEALLLGGCKLVRQLGSKQGDWARACVACSCSQVVVRLGTEQMLCSHMRLLLDESSWLTDDVINTVFAGLRTKAVQLNVASKHAPSRAAAVYTFSSFFYSKLTHKGDYNFEGVRRWTGRRDVHDIFADDLLLIPVLRYLQDEHLARKGSPLASSQWELEVPPSISSIQKDGSSCGVYVCAFADLLCQGWRPPFSISQRDVGGIRHALAHQLLAHLPPPLAHS